VRDRMSFRVGQRYGLSCGRSHQFRQLALGHLDVFFVFEQHI
jgi:hypothetical protein